MREGGSGGGQQAEAEAEKSRPVKLSFAAIIAFRLVSSGSLRIPLSKCSRASFLFLRLRSSYPSSHLEPRRFFPRGQIRTVVNISFEYVFFHLPLSPFRQLIATFKKRDPTA